MIYEILDDNDNIVNIIVADIEFVEAHYPGRYRQVPRELTSEYSEESTAIRKRRNQLLLECDWTQGKDVPDATSNLWAPYRQALRDITEQAGFPFDVQWPDPPTTQSSDSPPDPGQ